LPALDRSHVTARCTREDTFVGPRFLIELRWHDPENGVINDVATFGRDVVDACTALQLALVGDALVSTQAWLMANCRWTSPGALARALRRVVDYHWTQEERDYLSREPDDRAGHIFEALTHLRQYALTL